MPTRFVEWSPNEGIMRKLERLAFALVRTRPFVTEERLESKQRNPWTDRCRGLGGPFAIGILVGIPYISENLTGSTLIAALLLSAVDACLAVWCYTDLECGHGSSNRSPFSDLVTSIFSRIGEFPAFLIGWWQIQGLSAGFAVCCRSLSSIVDTVTGRHIEIFVEDHFGTFLPLGARMDLLALLVAIVPILMCALGMEESGFLRFCLILLTSSATLAFFGSSLVTTHLTNHSTSSKTNVATLPVPIPSFGMSTDVFECLPDEIEETLYTKILMSATLASVGFFGVYKICCPEDSVVLRHHRRQHSTQTKRFSLIGCLISTFAFIFYFLDATVLSKAPHTSRICRDPPLLWPLEGGWRIGVASLGISALALATFEFLIPLSSSVTKLANDGLLYRLLKKDRHDLEETKWTLITPLVFGMLSAVQSLLLDIKILLSLVSSSLMAIHIVVGASMLASRYQVRVTPTPISQHKINHCQNRTRSRRQQQQRPQELTSATTTTNQIQSRSLMTVNFLKSGMSKIPQEIKKLEKLEIDSKGQGNSGLDTNNDRTYLMDDVAIAPIEQRDSIELSLGSGVSGYESESDEDGDGYPDVINCEDQGETDIDAAVLDYEERLHAAALNGGAPLSPTAASARRVSFATIFLVFCCISLAASITNIPKFDLIDLMLAASSALMCFLLLVVISRQPEKKTTSTTETVRSSFGNNLIVSNGIKPNYSCSASMTNFFQYTIVPWCPAGAIFLHSCLLVEALDLCGFLFAIWLATGLIIYFSYGVSKSIAATSSLLSPSVLPSGRVYFHENRNVPSSSSNSNYRHHQHQLPISSSSQATLDQSNSSSFEQVSSLVFSRT